MVSQLKASRASDGIHRKLVIAYVDIGQAENWRWYWSWSEDWSKGESPPADWPEYILTTDPDGWEGCFPVAYWDDQWKDIVIYGVDRDDGSLRDYDSMVDELVVDGFDGIYLDWVEGYEDEAVDAEADSQGRDAMTEMVRFIEEIRDYAINRDPDFLVIQQNAAALCEGHPELLSLIDAIAQEAVWYDGAATDDWNDPDGYDIRSDGFLSDYYVDCLDEYLESGLPVFNCEYALECADEAYQRSCDEGYVPYCTRTALSELTTSPPPSPAR